MNAEEAKRASEKGAISAVERLIEQAAEHGSRYVDIGDYDISDSFGEEAKKYFEEKGYTVRDYRISW